MRSCGDCTLCCKLVPVRDAAKGMNKGAGERCRHQSFSRGCKVYGEPAMPACCRLWSCRWVLAHEGTENLSRPDRAGYVLDIMPDFITTIDHATGERRDLEIVQVWIDPNRPDAHKDPALRAFLAQLAAKQVFALIRLSDRDAFVLAAPSSTGGQGWLEIKTDQEPVEHSVADVVAALGAMEISFTKGPGS